MRDSIRKDNLERIHDNRFKRVAHEEFNFSLVYGMLSLFLAFLVALLIAHWFLPAVKS